MNPLRLVLTTLLNRIGTERLFSIAIDVLEILATRTDNQIDDKVIKGIKTLNVTRSWDNPEDY